MKRILFVVQGASGGVSRYLIDIISKLDTSLFKVGIVFNSTFEDEHFKNWRLSQNQIRFFNLDSLVREVSLFHDVTSIIELVKIIKNFRPDVLHAQSSKAGLVGRISAKLMRVKRIVYTPHAYAFLSSEFSRPKRMIYALVERFLSKTCTTITINCSQSENDHAMLHHIDSSSKFRVIPNAIPAQDKVDREQQRIRIEASDQDWIVGNVARVVPQKNPELFEKIAMKTHELDPRIKFLWIGINDENRESEGVRYLGEMDKTDLVSSAFDLFLSTSLFEGLSYSLLEAASNGVPVLASLVPGNDEFVRGYEYGNGFDLSESIDTIANKIIFILHQSKNITRHPYTKGFDSMINETLKIYQM